MPSFAAAASSSRAVAAAVIRPTAARRSFSHATFARTRSVAARAASSPSSSGGLHFVERREGERDGTLGSFPSQNCVIMLCDGTTRSREAAESSASSFLTRACEAARRFFSNCASSFFRCLLDLNQNKTHSHSLARFSFITRAAEDDGTVTFVFGDETQAAAAAAARSFVDKPEEQEEEREEPAVVPSSTPAAAAAPLISEEAAFAALEAFAPVAQAPAAAFEAMEAFAVSQQASAFPPMLPVIEEKEQVEADVAAALAGKKEVEVEVEEEVAAPVFFALAEEVQEEPAEEPEEAAEAAAAPEEEGKEEEGEGARPDIGTAAVSAPTSTPRP